MVFQAPAKALTAGSAAIDYALLAFPCDAAHASTFALAPGAFPGASRSSVNKASGPTM